MRKRGNRISEYLNVMFSNGLRNSRKYTWNNTEWGTLRTDWKLATCCAGRHNGEIIVFTDRKRVWRLCHRYDRRKQRKQLRAIVVWIWSSLWSPCLSCLNYQNAWISSRITASNHPRLFSSIYIKWPGQWAYQIRPSIFWYISRQGNNFAVNSGKHFLVCLVVVSGK